MTRPTDAELRAYQAALKAASESSDKTPGFVLMSKGVNVAAVARAVIRSLREPTAEMNRAGVATGMFLGDGTWTADDVDAATVWHAMIDAASPEVRT